MSNRLSTAQRRAAAPVQRGTELARTAPTGRRWQHRSAWSDVRVRAALAIGVPALSGLAAGLVMPRGPVVAAHALLLLVSGVAVGTAAGYALRSRWAMMLAPAAHLLVFELVRLGADGPTVDGVHFGVVGIMAFVVGRGFYALVTLFPMTVGAVYGVRLARGNRWPHPLTAIAGIAVIALAGLIMRPAGTPAILGADGQPLPGSVATLEKVSLGGHEQWISIRGHSVDNPVLLFLAGGPGGSHLGWNRPFFRELERDMVVVQWDQRGTGKSYAALEPVDTLTVDNMVADTIQLTGYLRDRFDEDKLYVLGNSWGTTLGVLAVQQRPDLYHAYIGAGQMVSQRATDVLLYDEMVTWADRNDARLAQTLRRQGPPPYNDVAGYAPLLVSDWQRVYPFDWPPESEQRSAETGIMGIGATEYNLVEKMNVVRGIADTFGVLYPQLQAIDFRRDVTELDVPVYLVQGRYEMRPRPALVPQWFDALDAPSKRMVNFSHSAHNPYNSEFAKFHDFVTDSVLPETNAAR